MNIIISCPQLSIRYSHPHMFLFAIRTLPCYIGLCPPKLNSEIVIHPSEITPDKEIIAFLYSSYQFSH